MDYWGETLDFRFHASPSFRIRGMRLSLAFTFDFFGKEGRGTRWPLCWMERRSVPTSCRERGVNSSSGLGRKSCDLPQPKQTFDPHFTTKTVSLTFASSIPRAQGKGKWIIRGQDHGQAEASILILTTYRNGSYEVQHNHK